MAALVRSIQVASNWLGRPLKKMTCTSWIHLHYSKNSFLGKANRKNRKGFRTCAWRAALCAASHKINGQRCAPPTKWLPKNRNVWFWCVYTIPLEPILSKIPEKIQSLRSAAVPQNGTASQGGGASLAARGQKISSP